MAQKQSKETFRFDNLLFDNMGIITGPMGPIATAEGLVKQGVIPRVDGLVRVGFDSNLMYQNLEGKGRDKELTGHGAYIVKFEHSTSQFYFFYIDLGARVLPIAIFDNHDSEDFSLELTPIGENREFEEKLTEEQLEDMFAQAITEDCFKIQVANE